jgi:hypothetical protein
MDELADYINVSDEWQSDVEDIIKANGWHSDCGKGNYVCHDYNGNFISLDTVLDRDPKIRGSRDVVIANVRHD